MFDEEEIPADEEPTQKFVIENVLEKSWYIEFRQKPTPEEGEPRMPRLDESYCRRILEYVLK
jgi:hypothetical protein